MGHKTADKRPASESYPDQKLFVCITNIQPEHREQADAYWPCLFSTGRLRKPEYALVQFIYPTQIL